MISRAARTMISRAASTMSGCVIRIIGTPIGIPDRHDGCYVQFYDPHDGVHGRILSTPERDAALVYPTVAAAMNAWGTPNRNHPLRPDGKPNKPLTAFTVEIVKLD